MPQTDGNKKIPIPDGRDFYLRQAGDISFSLVHPSVFVNEKSEPIEPHLHSCYEIYVYLSGDIGFVVHDRIYSLAPGDAIISGPNVYHRCIVRSACLHEHYCFLLRACEPEVTEVLNRMAALTHLHYDDGERKQFLSIMTRLWESTGEKQSPLAMRTAFYDLLLFWDRSSTASEIPAETEYTAPLTDILKYIGENYTSLQSVEEVASHFFISIATLERLFKKHLRTTPYRYLSGIRLASAKRALDAGESVAEAALRSGFSDCSHFIQRFKQEFGVTPNRYRSL